jgi:hypothetical protein
LASTIRRDDSIAVIGANSASLAAAGEGTVCFPGFWFSFWFIRKALPIKPAGAKVTDDGDRTDQSNDAISKSLTLSSIYISLELHTTAAPKPRREETA